MAKKPSKQNSIQGDINITNGDFVAGDKTLLHKEGGQNLTFENPTNKKHTTRPKSRNVNGNLDVSGGDVVFGDKIIKFFQESLNIYVFKDVRQLVVFLGFLILVSGTIGGTYWYSIQPKKLTGDYNIAIAQFGEIQEEGKIKPSQNAEKIRMKLFRGLQSEYDGSVLGFSVQVENKNMPLVTTDSDARKLAKKVNADIVIYGFVTVQPDGKHANFLPQFYVVEHLDTEEITGTSALAVELPFDLSELNSEDELNSQLRVRAEILFNFTKALIYYSQKDYSTALRTLNLAIKSAETLPETFEGQEVLYLLAAKAYTRQTDYENANQMLDQALLLNPDYARAHLGRGNIYYQQGKIIPQEGQPPAYNQDLLFKAKTEYELALQSFDGSEDPYIPIKARTNLGNVFLNLAFIHNGDAGLFAQATDHYLYVVHEFQRTKDPFLHSYAAIAYAGLGGIYQQNGEIDQALAAYQQAYALADDPEFTQEIARQIESLKRKQKLNSSSVFPPVTEKRLYQTITFYIAEHIEKSLI